MDRTRPQKTEGLGVDGGSISFVVGESITGKTLIEFLHDTVSRLLGENRGSGDGRAQGIAFDDGEVGRTKIFQRATIDENPVAGCGEFLDRTAHGQNGGFEDIKTVDFRRRGLADSEGCAGPIRQFLEETLSFSAGQLLGIAQALGPHGPTGKNVNGGHDRAGQTAATCFVNAAHPTGYREGKLFFPRPREGHGQSFPTLVGLLALSCFSSRAGFFGALVDFDLQRTFLAPEIKEAGTTGATGFIHDDFFDPGRVKGKHALDTFAIADAANGKAFVNATAFAGDDNTGENLDAFLITFFDPGMDLDGVADFEGGDLFFELFSFDFIDEFHSFVLGSLFVN
jgi:hypothetical protein